MPRRLMHGLRQVHRTDSIDTSIHGSDYNADAASALNYRMGPDNKSIRAQRSLEKKLSKTSLALSTMSEINGGDVVVNVMVHELEMDTSRTGMSLECIEYNRRQVKKVLFRWEDFVEGWSSRDKHITYEVCTERYATAVTIKEELRKVMHQIRELRNYCKALSHERGSTRAGRSASRSDIEYIEDKLDGMATAVEELQIDVEAERKSMLKAFRKADARHGRRHRYS